jgi:3-methylfumaryl-CoA hydratase
MVVGATHIRQLAVFMDTVRQSIMTVVNYEDWVGRTVTIEDEITAWPLHAMAAVLDREAAPDVVPPLWHWLYFLAVDRQSALGGDGHARRGDFLPPVELPRRMWAGGRLEFPGELRVGDRALRVSRIADVKQKMGKTGPLVFVVVRHEISTERGTAVVEEHDIVYRDHAGGAGAALLAPVSADWQREVSVDDVLLFRYSALTFNGHRIHYDRRYCTQTEHYPGLVVHGPLVATLLAELGQQKTGGRMSAFQFRAVSPLFDTKPFTVCGRADGNLWAQVDGVLAMTARATFAA